MNPAADPPAIVRSMRALALVALLGLVALGLAWELFLAPTGRGTLAIKVLPLALCVMGVVRHRMRVYRWLSLLVWLYFMEGVVRATGDRGISQLLAGAEIGLSIALFTACAVYVRSRLKTAAGAGA